jgi:hypothetical protein
MRIPFEDVEIVTLDSVMRGFGKAQHRSRIWIGSGRTVWPLFGVPVSEVILVTDISNGHHPSQLSQPLPARGEKRRMVRGMWWNERNWAGAAQQ